MTKCGCQKSSDDYYRSCQKLSKGKSCGAYYNGYYGYPILNGTSGYEKYIYGYGSGFGSGCCGNGPNYNRNCGYCNNYNYKNSYRNCCGGYGNGYGYGYDGYNYAI